MIRATVGIFASQGGVKLLLDTYTGASAAYSLRLLRSAYTGDAIEVRIDTTGQPTYDIGFVNGELDTATLEAYCTGGLDAYVTTWYDQSGNGYDATQTTDANQPQIVSSGSVILENGKPSVEFDGSNDGLDVASSNVLVSANFAAFIIANSSTSGIWATCGNNASWQRRFLFDNGTSKLVLGWQGGNTGSSLDSYTQNIQQLLEFFGENQQTGATAITTSYVNGSGGATDSETRVQTPSPNGAMSLGYNLDASSTYISMKCQEMLFFDVDQSSNRSGIETNINDFYSIYP